MALQPVFPTWYDVADAAPVAGAPVGATRLRAKEGKIATRHQPDWTR